MEGFNRTDALVFVHALRKIAAGPDADFVNRAEKVETGEASTPDEAMQRTLAGSPDPTQRYEGDYAVPPEQVVPVLGQIVANSQRQHLAYSFYAEMIRGAGRGDLADLFEEQGAGELKEMSYFLRRLSILAPGGAPIPVAPTPEPTNDIGKALNYLIAGEQQALVLFKSLHSMLGDNPMKYMIEQIMTDAQGHHDKLVQNLPAASPKSKVASVLAKLSNKVPVGAPGTEPAEVVAQREAVLQQQQLVGENQALRAQLDQAGQVAVGQQQQLESLGAENQNLQAQAQIAGDQAHAATEQAQLNAEQAAAQADAKMRLAIRIQQFRQTLADTVAADPVQEEGVGFGEQAGPGTIQTSSQQNAAAQEAAAMDPTGGVGAAPTQTAAKQQQEAAGAQQEAKKQTAQAQQATKQANMESGSIGNNKAMKRKIDKLVGALAAAKNHQTSTPAGRLALGIGGTAVVGTLLHKALKKERAKSAGDYTEGLRLMAKAKKAGVQTVGQVDNGDPENPRLPLAGMGTEVDRRNPRLAPAETHKQHINLAKKV